MLGAMNTYVQGSAQADQLRVDEHSQAAIAKKEANNLQQVVNEDEKKETKADDDLKAVRDHSQAIKDTLKKCIDSAKEAAQGVQALGRS
jgi:hypothetical protein